MVWKAATGARPDADYSACFELHIEQAARLEREQIDIGMVTDIPGIHRYLITMTGRATAALRACPDAKTLVTASYIITATEEIASLIETTDNKHFVATIKIDVWPNGAANVLCEAKMVLDMRASSDHSRDIFSQKLHSRIERISTRNLAQSQRN